MSTPTEPRALLGWTVPEHIEIGAFGENQVRLRCKLGGHQVHEHVTLETFETDQRIVNFLKAHAHGGEVVEYRPEPRQWREGDEEPPADVTLLRYADEDMPYPFLRRSPAGWSLEASADPSTWTSSGGWEWERIAQECQFHGPLTEVPVSASSVAPSPTNTTTPVPQRPRNRHRATEPPNSGRTRPVASAGAVRC